MTFRELLKITDSNTKVCVRLEIFGLYFETAHYPETYMQSEEAKYMLDMRVNRLYAAETESVIVVTLV